MQTNWKEYLSSYDDRRDIVVPGDSQQTLKYCADQFISIGNAAIKEKSKFNVALSGGSTPKVLFQMLATPEYRDQIDWNKIDLFWSDERNVAPDDDQSNYKMAMDAGFSALAIPEINIHRMEAEGIEIETAAKKYEELIQKLLPAGSFDLVMLGMGEDGHTASLFPKTHGLHAHDRLAIANFVPQLNTWRMTLTYECINSAQHISIYLIGKNKAEMLKRVLAGPQDFDELPIQNIGTRHHKALWIVDNDAASELTA